jgi:hypothetical protein
MRRPWYFPDYLFNTLIDMALDKKNLINLCIGAVLTLMVTWPTFEIVYSGYVKQSALLPVNAWLGTALLLLLLGGLLIALFGLLRRVHWIYFLWSQLTLSFWVFIIYLGRSRADREYADYIGDPDAPLEGPPEVLWYRFVFLILVGLVVGFLPLILRYLWRRYKARKTISSVH